AASSHLPYGKEHSRAELQSQQDVALNIIRPTRRSVWPRSANGTQPALAGRRPAEILTRRRRNAAPAPAMACPRPVSRPAAGSERSPPRARPKRRGRGRFYRSWAASRFMVLAADRPAGLVDRPDIVRLAVRPRQRDADHAVPRH